MLSKTTQDPNSYTDRITPVKPRHVINRFRGDMTRSYHKFIGHAYDLDVYVEKETEGDDHDGTFLIVCSMTVAEEKHGKAINPFNWDVIVPDENGNLRNNDDDVDINTAQLAEIYRLVADYLAQQEAGGTTGDRHV